MNIKYLKNFYFIIFYILYKIYPTIIFSYVRNRPRTRRNTSPEKVNKHVTWAKPIDNYPEKEAKRPQISAGQEPAQIKQYMNLQYNCKETQTEVQ